MLDYLVDLDGQLQTCDDDDQPKEQDQKFTSSVIGHDNSKEAKEKDQGIDT